VRWAAAPQERRGFVILSDFNFLQSIITIWRMFGFGVGVTSD